MWTADPLAATGDRAATNKYLAVYGVLGFFQSAFVLLGTAGLSIGALNASAKMHSTMLQKYDCFPFFKKYNPTLSKLKF